MADPATISALIGSVKAAWDFAKDRADELKDYEMTQRLGEISSQITALSGAILALQQEHSALVQAKDEAEAKVKEFRNWEMETADYQLCEVSPGVLVYSKEKNLKPTEQSPWLCTNCYQNREKGLLTRVSKTEFEEYYCCSRCPNKISVVLKERSRRRRHTISHGWKGHT